jgi:hypothetical protein
MQGGGVRERWRFEGGRPGPLGRPEQPLLFGVEAARSASRKIGRRAECATDGTKSAARLKRVLGRLGNDAAWRTGSS